MAVGEFGCSLEQAYDMSWAEFQIRLIAFKRKKKDEKEQWIYLSKLFREVAYNVYCLGFLFSKSRPKKIVDFWPIGGEITTSKINAQALMAARKRYEKNKNGTINA